MLAGIALTVVSYWYGNHHGLLPTAATQEAVMVDQLFNAMMVISTGLVCIIYGAMAIAIFRFRRRPGDTTDGPPVHGNIPLEILWTAIPAIIVLGIGVYSFDVYMAEGGDIAPMGHGAMHGQAHGKTPQPTAQFPRGAAIAATLPSVETVPAEQTRNAQLQREQLQDPATAEVRQADIPQRREAPAMGVVSPQIGPTTDTQGQAPELVVNVTGLQFAWLFSYPNVNVTTGELHLPVNREVKLNISANDVIHAFWVPEFRLKQDAIPGRQTEIRLTPTVVGDYAIVCAELCGMYHGAMRTQVQVQSQDEFDRWLQSQAVAQVSAPSDAMAMVTERDRQTRLEHHAHTLGITPDVLAQVRP